MYQKMHLFKTIPSPKQEVVGRLRIILLHAALILKPGSFLMLPQSFTVIPHKQEFYSNALHTDLKTVP